MISFILCFGTLKDRMKASLELLETGMKKKAFTFYSKSVFCGSKCR